MARYTGEETIEEYESRQRKEKTMLEVKRLFYGDLTEKEKEDQPNNGYGKENASYLKVTHDGEVIALESDAMEPEDARFTRDLGWIKKLLEKVYGLGLHSSQ